MESHFECLLSARPESMKFKRATHLARTHRSLHCITKMLFLSSYIDLSDALQLPLPPHSWKPAGYVTKERESVDEISARLCGPPEPRHDGLTMIHELRISDRITETVRYLDDDSSEEAYRKRL